MSIKIATNTMSRANWTLAYEHARQANRSPWWHETYWEADDFQVTAIPPAYNGHEPRAPLVTRRHRSTPTHRRSSPPADDDDPSDPAGSRLLKAA